MTDDPRGLADGDEGDEPTPISPEEEVLVSAMLAALPDPQLPVDVRRRIVTAVDSAHPTPGTDEAGVAPPFTPAPRHAGSAAVPAWRRPWVLSAAAVLVIVALAGATVVGLTRGGGSDAPQQLVLSQATPGPITISGRTYSSTDLNEEVTQLVLGDTPTVAPSPTDPVEAASGSDATSGDAAGTTEEKTSGTLAGTDGDGQSTYQSWKSSVGDAAAVAALTKLVQNPTSRQACVDQLASVPGAQPIAIDVGDFDNRPAAVIVLPDEGDPTKLAAWVVGPTCSSKDNPFPYRYERLTRP